MATTKEQRNGTMVNKLLKIGSKERKMKNSAQNMIRQQHVNGNEMANDMETWYWKRVN